MKVNWQITSYIACENRLYIITKSMTNGQYNLYCVEGSIIKHMAMLKPEGGGRGGGSDGMVGVGQEKNN